MVLTEPGRFRSTHLVDCALELLPSAKPLKHRAPVHFHAGSAEVEAEIRRLDGTEAIQPGTATYVRLVLREPMLLLPGDRFIVRMFSPVVTIGGGVVLDAGGHRYRKGEDAASRLRILERGTAADRIAFLVRESGHGMGLPELIARTGSAEREILAAARSGRFVFLEQPEPWLADPEWFSETARRLIAVLREFHAQNPLQPGLSKEDLRRRELGDAPPFLLDALLARTPEIVAEGDLLRHASHRLALKQDEEQALAAIEGAFERAGLAVPTVREVLAKSGVDAARARPLLQILIRDKRLVRVGDDLVFHASAVRSLKEMLAAHRGQRFSVPSFKDWTGISRKYAIPLLEYLDRERVTRREGDERLVL
jgi:selenocysteine-specific elongation factor